MSTIIVKGKTRYINDDNKSTWQNVWCHYLDPDTGTQMNGYLVDIYQIRDPAPTNLPTDEVYEIRSTASPQRSISASGSSDSCYVSMSGSLGAVTETQTITRKVWKQIYVGRIFRNDGTIISDVPLTDIKIAAEDVTG